VVRFYAVPAWELEDESRAKDQPFEHTLAPELAAERAVLAQALYRVEYRGEDLLERAEALAARATTGPAVYARPPGDLPALLRTADQLLLFVRRQQGERAWVWRCECGTRLAVPVALVRPTSIRCDTCGRSVELNPSRRAGESFLADPHQAQLNQLRTALAGFFREAMARGWSVVVEQ